MADRFKRERSVLFHGATVLSPASETRILLVGDMHLGRAPGGLPSMISSADLSPAAALKRVVATAIKRQVHAVAFAGDLVESSNALFEAYGPLQDAVTELDRHHIEVVAVTGNHDTQVLPRLADAMGSKFHVLGSAGTWTSHLVHGQAPLPVRLVGWSFPSPHFEFSPLRQPAPPAQEGEITLGLLHADLDVAKSRYAPTSSRALQAVGYQGWFLGHIHRPDALAQDGAPFYLGSLTPLDPTETDTHGPVLVTVGDNASLTLERLPLAPLRWEHLVIPCPDHIQTAEEIRPLLLKSMLNARQNIPAHLAPLHAMGFRLRLTGRVREPNAVHTTVAALQIDDLNTLEGDTTLFVEKLVCAVTGAHDLERMAIHGDPIGLLARRILELEKNADPVADTNAPLLAAAEDLQKELARTSEISGMTFANHEPRPMRQLLIRIAYRLLDGMVADRGDDRVSP